jgi:hypothetical protein
VTATTLLGHHAEMAGADGARVTMRRENVVLTATHAGNRYEIRTRIAAALTPFFTAIGAFVLTFMLLYGRTVGFGHVLGWSLLAAVGGWLVGTPARRNALDRSRAAIAAFASRVGRW